MMLENTPWGLSQTQVDGAGLAGQGDAHEPRADVIRQRARGQLSMMQSRFSPGKDSWRGRPPGEKVGSTRQHG